MRCPRSMLCRVVERGGSRATAPVVPHPVCSGAQEKLRRCRGLLVVLSDDATPLFSFSQLIVTFATGMVCRRDGDTSPVKPEEEKQQREGSSNGERNAPGGGVQTRSRCRLQVRAGWYKGGEGEVRGGASQCRLRPPSPLSPSPRTLALMPAELTARPTPSRAPRSSSVGLCDWCLEKRRPFATVVLYVHLQRGCVRRETRALQVRPALPTTHARHLRFTRPSLSGVATNPTPSRSGLSPVPLITLPRKKNEEKCTAQA